MPITSYASLSHAFAAPITVTALRCHHMRSFLAPKSAPRRPRYWQHPLQLPESDARSRLHCAGHAVLASLTARQMFANDATQIPAADTESDILVATVSVTGETAHETSPAHQTEAAPDEEHCEDTVGARKKTQSAATRRKISLSMIGVPKSAKMRAKLSASMKALMKTRSPWNKGKTLSLETRRRMSESRRGRSSWNKGRVLTEPHKRAIAAARANCKSNVSDATRRLLQLARRRPGDGIVSGGAVGSARTAAGEFPLVDTADIHAYITLRRALRGWSDSFASRNGRRPSLADVRRVAPPQLVRDFEAYVTMRNAIRGLAVDVYGGVDTAAVPVVRVRDAAATGPRNNNGTRRVHVTKHGNKRLGSDAEVAALQGGQGAISCDGAEGAALRSLGVSDTRDDMWDGYDAPVGRPSRANGFGVDHTLFGAHEIRADSAERARGRLSMNDYRLIGKYRLMESKDIYRFVQLRRELERWSAAFKKRMGKTPRLSDVKDRANSGLYTKFCRYLEMRHSMSGLMKEVYGADMDSLQSTFDEVNEAGRTVLDQLRASANGED